MQEEAAHVFAELRSKMIVVPRPATSGGKRLHQGQGAGRQRKGRKTVTFQERPAAVA